jgi:hypothetical protein
MNNNKRSSFRLIKMLTGITRFPINKTMFFILMVLCINSVYGQYTGRVINLPDSTTKDTVRTLEEVIVTAQLYPQFQKVGENNQPAWTLVRKFPATRVYIMVPKGTVMYEKWFDMRTKRNNGGTEVRMRDEFAFGLAKRLELDLYLHTVYRSLGEQSSFGFRGFSWEVRYALAEWGKIWGNPTLYFEHKLLDGKYQGIEPKILLGDRIGKNGIWGVNLIYEGYIAPTRNLQEREFAYTASYAKIINDDLTIGVSNMFRYNDVDATQEWYVGPALQYRFNKNAYINMEILPGLNGDAKQFRNTVIFGWRF